MVSRKEHTQVRAEVTERVTGNTATAVDTSCQFTSSLYVIQFKNTPKYFKPALRFVVKVKVTHPNKTPARYVPTVVSAHGKAGNNFIDMETGEGDPNVLDLTDKNGEAKLVATQRCPVYSGTHYS